MVTIATVERRVPPKTTKRSLPCLSMKDLNKILSTREYTIYKCQVRASVIEQTNELPNISFSILSMCASGCNGQ